MKTTQSDNTAAAVAMPRYGRVAIALHWLIGAGLLAQIAFGFLLDEIAPRGTPARAGVINLHKSLGIALAVLIVLRLVWRLRHRPPAWPVSMSIWQQRAARIGHAALYACMIVMPASGYLASNFSKHGVRLFSMRLPAWGPDLPPVYAALNLLHVTTALLFTALIVGHVLIAARHALVGRDGALARISPRGRGDPSSMEST